MLLREWAMQSIELGTRPSCAGERSVVRTRHQSGLSWGLSTSSTVWPLRTVNSDPLLAMKSWMTTVNSEPPDNCGGRHKVTLKIQIHAIKTTNMTKKQAYRTYPLVMWHCQWAQKVSHWPWTFTSHVSTKTTPPGMSLRRKHHTEEWSGSKKKKTFPTMPYPSIWKTEHWITMSYQNESHLQFRTPVTHPRIATEMESVWRSDAWQEEGRGGRDGHNVPRFKGAGGKLILIRSDVQELVHFWELHLFTSPWTERALCALRCLKQWEPLCGVVRVHEWI